MSSDAGRSWTFVTNHTRVLLCLDQNPDVRMRDVADTIGITERAAQRILADLVEAGYVRRTRTGRRNHYTIDRSAAMRHTSQLGHGIGQLLDLLELGAEAERPTDPEAGSPDLIPGRNGD